MGTSSSAKGPSGRSPLVPAWADAEPGKPLPEPEGQRFRGFRTEIGRAIAGGGGSMSAALAKYSNDATAGPDIGPRRFGPAYAAGAEFAQMLSGEEGEGKLDLASLTGQPLDVAAQSIAEALSPENADADQIRAAVQDAMAEVLGDQETFDQNAITTDQIAALLVEFFARILFQEISAAAGEAWKKAPNVDRCTAAENELFEIVRISMDIHLSPRLAQGLAGLTRDEITNLERTAIEDIWKAWGEEE